MRKPRTASQGFSLAEVLVAMFVLTVGISGVLSALWWGHSRIDSGKYMSEATNHCRAFYETIVSEGLINDAAIASGGSWPNATSGLADPAAARVVMNAAPFNTGNLTFQPQVTGQSSTALSSGNNGNSNELSSDLQRFRRNIVVTRLDPAGRSTSEFYVDDLALIQIRVYWEEKNYERFAELKGIAKHNIGS